ncbi:MAG: sulfotransferase domain-containing protein [Symploca sp. SIO1B1]|nr:sulfotransferase domain-containing protein [Symploca sp. SIO1B1]
MPIPNFLVIGAAKSGTTSLYAYSKQHPEIYMSPLKEPRFFAFEGEKIDFCGPGSNIFNQETITSIEAYRALFDGISDEKAIGEASPAYLCVPKAAECIYHYIPDVKLIVILRQPAERAYSSFLHTVKAGAELNIDFTHALQEEEKRILNNWGFIWRHKTLGFYYPQLKPYFDRFNRNQIRVYLYEDLCNQPVELMQDLFQFLGVDDKFIPDVSSKFNATGIPQNRFLYYLLFTKKSPLKPIKNFLRALFPGKLRTPLAKGIKSKLLVKPTMSPEIKKQLTQEYREDILKVQDLIQKDLSKWLE